MPSFPRRTALALAVVLSLGVDRMTGAGEIGTHELSCRPATRSPAIIKTRLGTAPALVRIPSEVSAAPIILWHGFGPPANESELMEALPLDDVPAIKVYLGLPLFGERSPSPEQLSLADRQARDYGLLLFEPAVLGAAGELPPVVAALQKAGCLKAHEPISLFGFSASGAAVLHALFEHQVPVSSAVIVNGVTGLKEGIQAFEHATGTRYAWSTRSTALAQETDYAVRPQSITSVLPYPALLFIHGTGDEVVSSTNVAALYDALAPLYSKAGETHRLQMAMTDTHHGWTTGESNQSVRRLAGRWFNEFGRKPAHRR